MNDKTKFKFDVDSEDAIDVFEELLESKDKAVEIFEENTKIIITKLQEKIFNLEDDEVIEDDLQQGMIRPLLKPLLDCTDYHKVKRFIETFNTFENA